MSYLTQTYMANDHHLISRSAACAATLGVRAPLQWAARHSWELAATPGWADAYSAAGGDPEGDPAAHVPRLGSDPTVITDEMIRKAVEGFIMTPSFSPAL